MTTKENILLAGATGYLGNHILRELIKQDFPTRVIVRNPKKLEEQEKDKIELIQAEVTHAESLRECCKNIDTVISTVGITRQKDGLTYMDVDYQANMNLLEEAKRNGVRRFIYVSVLNGEKLKHLKICEAKERFVDELKQSGLEYVIIRPNGFFSDMSEFFQMAQKGRIYLFGDGRLKSNPIHGEDLARICVDAIHTQEREIPAGGPQLLSQNEIANIAFSAADRKPKITHIPDWVRRLTLKLVKALTNSKTYGPVEFFLTVMGIEMIAPKHGKHSLFEYYRELKNQSIES